MNAKSKRLMEIAEMPPRPGYDLKQMNAIVDVILGADAEALPQTSRAGLAALELATVYEKIEVLARSLK